MKIPVFSSFDRDMRKEGWRLISDVGSRKRRFFGWDLAGPSFLDTSEIALVSYVSNDDPKFDCGEGHLHPYVTGETMLKRAQGQELVGGEILTGCNWGQRHGEALLRNQNAIPLSIWLPQIILPGTVWEGRYDYPEKLKGYPALMVPVLINSTSNPKERNWKLCFRALSFPPLSRVFGGFSNMESFVHLKEITTTPML